jgi:pimeloyl-ACP methyl ester carboxylesterase
MLRKPAGDRITATVGDYSISKDVPIHAKVLRRSPTAGRRAIYIHGGGAGGNHTLIERPSRLLVEDGFFDEIILPDRRGDGASSPLTGMMTMREQSGDMKALLDEMGLEEPLTAMGMSYGGPMALTLATWTPVSSGSCW